MAIEDLLRAGRIRRETVSSAEIRDALKLADRDLRVARKLMADEPDWGFTVAYNAVLQAAAPLYSPGATARPVPRGTRTHSPSWPLP